MMKDKIERTVANKRRRMEKDRANQQRAMRKRAQRKSSQEMALLSSPNFDPRFISKSALVAITRKHFGMGSTDTRLAAFLADEGNWEFKNPRMWYHNTVFDYYGMRKPFVLNNGMTISIQQSASHMCSKDSVEISGPWHAVLKQPDAAYFGWVPLATAVAYIDALESSAA